MAAELTALPGVLPTMTARLAALRRALRKVARWLAALPTALEKVATSLTALRSARQKVAPSLAVLPRPAQEVAIGLAAPHNGTRKIPNTIRRCDEPHSRVLGRSSVRQNSQTKLRFAVRFHATRSFRLPTGTDRPLLLPSADGRSHASVGRSNDCERAVPCIDNTPGATHHSVAKAMRFNVNFCSWEITYDFG